MDIDVCAVFPPTVGFFLLVFLCNSLADPVVLQNKDYYYKLVEEVFSFTPEQSVLCLGSFGKKSSSFLFRVHLAL